MTGLWKDCDGYWLHLGQQQGPDWFQARVGRPTASVFYSCTGKSIFAPDLGLVARQIAGVEKKEFNYLAKTRTKHGNNTEPQARDWYCRSRQVEVEELGLAVPKWDQRIGASVDGMIVGGEGIIEIKAPLEMYQPIVEHMDRLALGWVPPPGYHQHIWPSHYAQMQGQMAIVGKKWCDYIVFCTPANKVFVDRVHFSPTDWNEIYQHLDSFINQHLQPLLPPGLPLMPS